MKKDKKTLRNLSPAYLSQIHILRSLCVCSSSGGTSKPRLLEIGEIAELSGLVDEKEALRYLYILEGNKLVTPYPSGDFTSKTWHATAEGVRLWKTISQELEMAA